MIAKVIKMKTVLKNNCQVLNTKRYEKTNKMTKLKRGVDK